MTSMSSRERVLAAINFETPDKIPSDLGTTNCTSIARKAYSGLKKVLGVDKPDVLMMEDFQLSLVDEEVMVMLETDTRGVPAKTMLYPKKIIDNNSYYDHFGIKYLMPKAGLYYDMVENPMSEMELSEIEEYPWPDHDCPASLQGLREQAKKLKEENRYAIVGDIVNSGIFEPSHYLRGFQNFLTDMLADEDIACCIMEGMLKFQCARQEDYLREVGEYLDVVFVGDDLATAESLLMSPDIYRSIVKPYHKKYFDFIKSRTKAKLMFHSCGAIEPLINDLIEVGVDILNPVQVSAKGMDTKLLKEKYDKKICFWGAIDTSRVLPTGTVKDVEDEVRRRIDDLGPSGYVVTAVHDIQADVPPENVAAMYRAVKEYKIQ